MQGPVVRVIKRVCLRVGASRSSRGNLDLGTSRNVSRILSGGRAGLSSPCHTPDTHHLAAWPPLIVHLQSCHRKPCSGSRLHQHWSGFIRRWRSSPSSWPHRIDDITMSRLVSVGLRQRGNTCKNMSARLKAESRSRREWVETYFSNPQPHPLPSQSTPLGADSSSFPPCLLPASPH